MGRNLIGLDSFVGDSVLQRALISTTQWDGMRVDNENSQRR